MKLDQVCTIADDVYFEVVEHLGLYDVMVEEDPDHLGSAIRCTQNTDKGEELYLQRLSHLVNIYLKN
jgi:hypothetical protein